MESDDAFCESCKAFEWREDGGVGSALCHLGPLKSVRTRTKCPRCRFTVHCILDHTLLHQEKNPKWSQEEQLNGIRKWDDSQLTIRIYASDPCHFYIEAGRPAMLNFEIDIMKPNQRNVKPWIDYKMARQWLGECMGPGPGHKTCRSNLEDDTSASLQDLRLVFVDVERHLLIRPQRHISYVALSYVWGTTTQDYSETVLKSTLAIDDDGTVLEKQPISLLKLQLPRTLLDAIHFTKRLGQRYLWIDALCCPQADPIARMAQIKGMDRIFQNCLYTVVVLEGRDSSSGIPGVSSSFPRHLVHPSTPEQGLSNATDYRITESEDFNDSVAKSYWSTRAWTLQEGLLSPRRFVIGNEGMHFVCHDSVVSDDGVYQGSDVREHLFQFGLSAALGAYNASDLALLYMKVVNDYTSRNLTWAGDCLRALKGVMSFLEKQNPAFVSFGGLPCDGFGRWLLWEETPGKHSYKRPEDWESVNWPSWSWIGHWTPIFYFDFRPYMRPRDPDMRGPRLGILEASFAIYEEGTGATSLQEWVARKRAQDGRRGIRHNQLGEARLQVECFALQSKGKSWQDDAGRSILPSSGGVYYHETLNARARFDLVHFGASFGVGVESQLYLLAVDSRINANELNEFALKWGGQPLRSSRPIKLLVVMQGAQGYVERIGVAWMDCDQFLDNAQRGTFSFDDPLHSPRHVQRLKELKEHT